MVNKQHKNVEP